MTTWLASAPIAAAAAALAVAGALLVVNRRSAVHRSLSAVLGMTAVIHAGNGVGLLDAEHALFWRRLALLGELAQPVGLLLVGVALIREIALGDRSRDLWRVWPVVLVMGLLATFSWSDEILMGARSDRGMPLIVLGSLGRITYAFILVALVLGLAQIEQILRAAREPVRWQLKFVLIGLGGIAGYEIYQASRLLLVPTWQVEYAVIGGLVSLASLGLIGYGLARRLLVGATAKVYISSQFLFGSFTVLGVGLYLVGVGLIGEIVLQTGWSAAEVLSTLVGFAAAVGLVAVLFSRRARAELRRFIARHFYRSKYDYRAKWLEVTDAFRACASVESILDRLIELLSRTFGAARISVWMSYEADRRFHQVRSVNTEQAPHPLDVSHPVVVRLATTDEPVGVEEFRVTGPSGADPFFEATRAVLCAPIRSDERLLAFVTLSGEIHGERYGTDDGDLLRAIARHVAVLLSHAGLAEERHGAAELEALHRFSAFCLHDLKNLASGLSLVAENAKVHGQDPAFHQSAMRTVANTVQKMMGLMTKLSLRSGSVPAEEQGGGEPADVQAVIAETFGAFNGGLRVPVRHASERLPPVRIRKEQLHQVLLNVILNATQAVGGRGEIRISTEQANGSVVITVDDSGPGIPLPALRTLFHPFQTTKKEGWGVGLYECKRIVEAHRGTIRVESEVGRGTQVRITLPFAEEPPVMALSPRTGEASGEGAIGDRRDSP
jgi:hypothetical protein